MTRPDMCGAAGGAISMWINLIDCPQWAGIVSSIQLGAIGSVIYCYVGNIVYETYVFSNISTQVRKLL